MRLTLVFGHKCLGGGWCHPTALEAFEVHPSKDKKFRRFHTILPFYETAASVTEDIAAPPAQVIQSLYDVPGNPQEQDAEAGVVQ